MSGLAAPWEISRFDSELGWAGVVGRVAAGAIPGALPKQHKLLATLQLPNAVTTTAVNFSPAQNLKGNPGEAEDLRELQTCQCISRTEKVVHILKAMHMPKKDLGMEKTPVSCC